MRALAVALTTAALVLGTAGSAAAHVPPPDPAVPAPAPERPAAKPKPKPAAKPKPQKRASKARASRGGVTTPTRHRSARKSPPLARERATRGVSRSASSLEAVRRCIVHRESRGNYRARNPHSTASGAYQFLDSTWRAVTGLRPPASAYSKAVQDAAFRKLYANGRGRAHWYLRGGPQCW